MASNSCRAHQTRPEDTCSRQFADGSVRVSLMDIDSGSWTASSVSQPGKKGHQRAKTHKKVIMSLNASVAMIQLSQEEAARYKDLPVVLDFRSGFGELPLRAHAPFECLDHALSSC